jgi:hypothetical protein
MRDWQSDMRRWRCSLSSGEVLKLREPSTAGTAPT